jgi:hypothetical protein
MDEITSIQMKKLNIPNAPIKKNEIFLKFEKRKKKKEMKFATW